MLFHILLVLVIFLHVCESGTNLDSHFKPTITERPDFVSTITVSNGGPEGTWKKAVYCPVDTFASGYAMKVCLLEGGGWVNELVV